MPRPSQIDPLERQIVLVLRDARVKQRVSATQLAASVGLSRSTVTHLENDDARPTLWVLLKLCDGLGMEFSACLRQAVRRVNEPGGKRAADK